MTRFLLLLALLPALAGCTVPQRYPSLLPRAIEQRNDAEPQPAAPVAVPDPQLDAQLTDAATRRAANAAAFASAAQRADALVRGAQGRAAGSEPWLTAQTALGDLDVLAADSAAEATTLEQLLIERATRGAPAYPALEAAFQAARAQADDQRARISTLAGSLGG